jgi:hypothetical protein
MMGCIPAYMNRNMVRRNFNIKGNDCVDFLVRSHHPHRILIVPIADRILLHTLCFVSSGFRAEEARGGGKGCLATVPVCKPANGLHATTATADDPASSDAASERGLSPGAFTVAASNDNEDSAKSASATCRATANAANDPAKPPSATHRAASDAASGPASASIARRPILASRTTLRPDEVKGSIFFGASSLKDGVSLFSLSRPS